VLAQYDTPASILSHPADEFVAQFVGADRALKRLSALDGGRSRPARAERAGRCERCHARVARDIGEDALSMLLVSNGEPLLVVDRQDRVEGLLTLEMLEQLLSAERRRADPSSVGADGVRGGGGTDYPELQRRQLELRGAEPSLLHRLGEAQLGSGALAGAQRPRRPHARRRRDRNSRSRWALRWRPSLPAARAADDPGDDVPLHDPLACSVRAARRAVGANVYSAEIALVSYTLLILFRNILTGLREVPAEVLDAADGMGMTRAQLLLRVELPLALPAIVAGLRIAVVTIIALATIVYTIYNADSACRFIPRSGGAVQDRVDRRRRLDHPARAPSRRYTRSAAATAHTLARLEGS